MEEQINKFRFFIPSASFLFFIYILNPEKSNQFLAQFASGTGTDIIQILIGGPLLVLTLGFIISSLGAFLINFSAWTISKESRTETAHHNRIKWFLSLGNQEQVAKVEFENWKNVSKSEMEYIRNQIDKRWQMFVVNINMCISLILITFLWFFSERSDAVVMVVLISLLVVFIFNSHAAYTSVHSLDKKVSES